ncbi:Thioredoxin-like protein CDSP32- chloroplastic [Striga hermonthica]|uniref:Thioredoxin-like protein CDSP32- chloroplastic n=1 Tax=Striga hermonthica TaxID=68872 RepID=A0A9N7R2V4_STRHE|nr:Thioredoxin-like protein CDSP32- chloroplastic [Striga hermonthica]
MATIVNFALSFSHSSSIFRHERTRVSANSSLKIETNNRVWLRVSENSTPHVKKHFKTDNEGIERIHSPEEFDEHLLSSEEKLVIAHFSTGRYKYNSIIRRFMEEQCLVSNEQKKVNQASRFQPRKLADNILYYGYDPFSPVVEVKSGDDLVNLIKIRKVLVVVNVVKDWCSPCAKIYPGVLKLASQLVNKVVFARMNVDENGGFMRMMREMDVRRMPAFLFFENGDLRGKNKNKKTSGEEGARLAEGRSRSDARARRRSGRRTSTVREQASSEVGRGVKLALVGGRSVNFHSASKSCRRSVAE